MRYPPATKEEKFFVVGFKRDGSGPYFKHRTKGSWTLHKNQRHRTTYQHADDVADNCNRIYTKEGSTSDWQYFTVGKVRRP